MEKRNVIILALITLYRALNTISVGAVRMSLIVYTRHNAAFMPVFILFLSYTLLLVFAAQAQPINLLPEIPFAASNPHAATMFNGVKTGNTTYNGDFKDGDETLLAAYAFLHPGSPYKNNTAVRDRLLFLLDNELTEWSNGTKLADIQNCFQGACAYLMLKTYSNSTIPVDKKSTWESGIQKNVTSVLSNTNVYDKLIPGALWLNGDIRLAMGAFFGALALGDTASATKARAAIETCMTKTVIGDGGTHYVGYQNESPSYHGEATIRSFAWFYIITQSPAVKNFIISTKNYIPLVYVPVGKGYAEWSSSPAWKPYYNQTTLKLEALAKAYLSADWYNYAIGQGSQHLYLGFLYRSGLTARTLPDNFMLYDKNCLGPRGRYGAWGVVGTLRDPSKPGPELTETPFYNMDGTNTFVGAFILDANASASTYPINAAFHGAAPQIKLSAGAETDWSRGNKWKYLTGKDCNNSITRSNAVYGLAARYRICENRFKETGWDGMQQWVVTQDRVIGLCEIEATADKTVYGLAQRIALVSGRKNASGTRKILNKVDDNTFEYGNLRIKVHAKDYTGPVKTNYFGIMNDTSDDYSAMIELHDTKSGNDIATAYTAGTRRFALIEATNNTKTYATGAVKLALANGLFGFEFQEQLGRKVRIIHNITGSAITYSGTMTCPYSKTRLLTSCDPVSGMNAAGNEGTVQSVPISGGSASVTQAIPAYAHILILNSDIAADHTAGFKIYETVFTGTTGSIDKPNDLDLAGNGALMVDVRIMPSASSVTLIRYHAPTMDAVRFSLFNARGQQIACLTDMPKQTGMNCVAWSKPGSISIGVLYVELEQKNNRICKKIVLGNKW